MEDSYSTNEPRLQRLILYFRIASLALATEVGAWIIDLSTGT